jgi:hypothetical protein
MSECGMATVTAGGQSMTGCRLPAGHLGQHSPEAPCNAPPFAHRLPPVDYCPCVRGLHHAGDHQCAHGTTETRP